MHHILLFAALFALHFAASDAHASSHARRSQAIKTSIERRQLFNPGGSGSDGGLLGGGLSGILGMSCFELFIGCF
jgi:hypothetical protein